ncbi:hyoscyamine 6-dioxygenase-like [Tripterygium wilfordii]|uniref:Hyoscyamine 6-dioxygenase-like n=1 Tax=Tripterygium wilfordii TaxID=458696 RepID=A0A7J7CCX2_TRIWF|nr:hyoscyamine 6-dioxygenase-like [Tripterygium wilfordii]
MATSTSLLSGIASSTRHVPSNYIRPPSDRPKLDEVVSLDESIPLIDLQDLNGPNRSKIIEEIGQACQNYGFFQVKNHGISDVEIDNMLKMGSEFFHLPESEKMKMYSEDMFKKNRLSTSFNVKTEEVSSWRDYLRLHCYPLEDYIQEWPNNPPSFKSAYDAIGYGQHCLLGRNSQLNCLDKLALSNGHYKSVLHRAVVNCSKERISIPTFHCPSPDAVIAPAAPLIDDDHPVLYKKFTYAEYYAKFWNRGLNTETCLDAFKTVLHDWSDDHCLKLLKNCYKAIPDNGKLIVVEGVFPDTPDDASVATKLSSLSDVTMMTQNPGGKERKSQEFMALVTGAGFSAIRYECCVGNFWVMEFYK